jgi:hypothetical protein
MKIKGEFTSKCLSMVKGYLHLSIKDLSLAKRNVKKVKLVRSTATCQVDMYSRQGTNVLGVI